jgi:hypothetical protein
MRTRSIPVSRLSCSLLAIVVAATAATAGLAQSASTARGTTLTTRVTALPGQGAMADMPGINDQYTTVSVSAAGRTRTDVVEGSMEPVYSKGSYTLSDSTGMIVVQPATKTFFSLSTDMANSAQSMMRSTGMSMKLADVTVKLDTLGDGGTIDGRATQHYRLTASYSVTIDMSGMGIDVSALGGMAMPAIKNEAVTEYWIDRVASVPAIALGPFGMDEGSKSAGVGAMTMTKELTEKMAAASAALPAGLRVRTTTRLKMSGLPDGSTSSSGNTTELSGIKAVDVDLSQLVLPAGYTEKLMPGMESLPDPPPLSKDGGAKWRIRPGG